MAEAASLKSWPAAGTSSWLFFQSTMDEVKISSVERSPEWIRAEYANQSAPAGFYKILSENTVSIYVGPANEEAYASQTKQFSATVVGGCGGAVTWSLNGLGSVSATGLYTAPASIAEQQRVTVTASGQGGTGTATVLLMPPLGIGVTPSVSRLYGGQVQQFSAAVSNATNTAVTWSVSPAGAGTVTAASVVDPAKTASAIVTLTPGQGVQSISSGFAHALDLVASAVCRRPHVGPVVTVGPPQSTGLNGQANLAAVVTNYTLEPDMALSYTWTKLTGPGTVLVLVWLADFLG
jgi:hypothetical protein